MDPKLVELLIFALFVIAVLSILYIRNQKENALLKSFGLEVSNEYKKIDMPPSSQSLGRGTGRVINFQSYSKPLTSIHNRNLFIFCWSTPWIKNSPALTTVFSLTNKRGRKFPKFICGTRGMLDQIKYVDYSEHQEFSSKFHLTSQDETDEEVRKLFDNPSLHEYLLKNKDTGMFSDSIMSIESNGNKIFYYWWNYRVPAKKFPEIISEIENLHAQYFDV
jgi:hypothetical protein